MRLRIRKSDRNNYFSQEGEDVLLSRVFDKKQTPGFYIDIGAHHPLTLSNTYFFYLKGWRGINIDAKPGTKALFDKHRPEDINIESGISNKDGLMDYYIFEESAYNSFDSAYVSQISNKSKLIETKKTKVTTLNAVLSKYNVKEIDFLSLDVEGSELNVLQSFDLNTFKPKVFVVEDHSFLIDQPDKSPIYRFMQSKNYMLFAKLFYSTFYVHFESKYLVERMK